jgi:hypothetical protein
LPLSLASFAVFCDHGCLPPPAAPVIEHQIAAMSEKEWRQLLELVPSATLKDYQRIRKELLAKGSNNNQDH